MNKFAAINLKKRIEAKANAENLTGSDREVFCFIAQGCGEIGFNTLMHHFGGMGLEEMVFAMKRLMDRGLLHQMYSSTRYYTCAV